MNLLVRKNNIYNFLLYIYLFSFLIQFISLDIGLSHVKLFMITTILILFYLFKVVRIRSLFDYEILWLLSYFCIMISGLYASEKLLAIQIFIGQVVLVSSFLLLRFLLKKVDYSSFEKIFLFVGKYFIYVSILLYISGIIFYYILHKIPPKSYYLNDHSIRIFGLYLEGSFPRFMGLAESPNNYTYFAILFMWFFKYKRHYMLVFVTLITLIFTMSSTCFAVLIVQFFILLFFCNRKTAFKMIFSVFFIFILVYFMYNKIDYIKELIDYRIERNSTGSGRFDLWQYVYSLLLDSPVFGYGANQSRILIAPFRGLVSTHNNLLEMMLTTGLIGGFVYLTFIFLILRRSIIISLSKNTPMFIITTTSFILFGLANNTLHIEYVVFYLGFLYFYNSNHFNSIST